MIIDKQLRSWAPIPDQSDFPIQNLPFGVFERPGGGPRLATAIGDHIADLYVLADHGFFDDLQVDKRVFQQTYLNDFMALGKKKTQAVRYRLAEIMDDDLEEWDASELADFFLLPRDSVVMRMPVKVGDYTDFYSSEVHATNVGSLFREPENALLPNWKHLPVGYHGRASSIVVSGTPIRRPAGQVLLTGSTAPVFQPTQRLDFELELAFVIGRPSALGQPVSVSEAEDYIFGLLLFNDWSARDIQRWEYQPLGPFLGKSFASTVSPWVVTLDALAPFRTAGPAQDPPVLPYLQQPDGSHLDLQLEVEVQPGLAPAHTVCRTNSRYLYWSMAQQLAHQTSNGCNLQIGDLYASGTISGPDPDSFGSLLELTRNATQPLHFPDGSTRTFLEDGDTVTLRGYGERDGLRIGFGEARGAIIS